MKHTSSSLHILAASAAVFALTFCAGYGTGEVIVRSADHDGVQAYILRSRFSSSASSSSSSSSARRLIRRPQSTVRRLIRGVRRSTIVRPSTRRSVATGSTVPVRRKTSEKLPIKAACGDDLLIRELGEECDDGNAVSGDGCSASCKVEAGFSCAGRPSVCTARCGDGIVTPAEKCDDGNLDGGDGCSAVCKIEFGYVCPGSPSECEPTPYCGDGVKASTEQCDDGNTQPGDGCSAVCKTE